MGLSDPQRGRGAVRDLCADELSRSARRIVVARARSGDRATTIASVCTIDGRNRTFDCTTVAEKRALYDELYWWLRARPTEEELRSIVRNLAACYQVDIAAFCKELCMSWEELAELAADPLVTIGAHTVNHPMLAKLPKETAALGDGFEPLGHRGGAFGAAAASVVSGRRSHLGRAARIRDRRRSSASRRR